MTTQIFTMWENGRSLKNSPRAFSPKADKEEYDRLHNLSAIEIFTQASEDAIGKGISGLDAFNASTSAISPLLSARSEWATRAQGFIIHHLLQENLYGFGFEPPRIMCSQPFEIPSACWKGQIRWHKDELTSDGLKFSHIRVLSKAVRLRLINSEVDTASLNKPGRPGYKIQILKAYAALNAAGKIDPRNSLQSHYPSVIEWLDLNLPEGEQLEKPPSNKTLQKHLSSLFNGLKKSSKL